ncbi:hypothetical protein Mapa_003973 [Marchantia paleacea]|nr:hypothetical protein Mapa_003973 [Marchantia paleacea]
MEFERAGNMTVLVLASIFLTGVMYAVPAAAREGPAFDSGLQLTDPGKLGLVGQASYYTAPYVPCACYGNDQSKFPAGYIMAAGGDGAPNIWNDGKNCGRYFGIDCNGAGCWQGNHHIDVKIVDRCPNGCSGGRAFDLTYEAFGAIADRNQGVITVFYGQNPNPLSDAQYSFNFTGLDLPAEFQMFQRSGVILN